MNILIKDCGHLQLLDGAYPALGEHDEDGNVLLSSQAIDGSRSSVTTCCANDGEVMPVCQGLATGTFCRPTLA